MNRISTWILVVVMGLACVERVAGNVQCTEDVKKTPPGAQCACGDDLHIIVEKKHTCNLFVSPTAKIDVVMPRPQVAVPNMSIPNAAPTAENPLTCSNCGLPIDANGENVTFVLDSAVCGGSSSASVACSGGCGMGSSIPTVPGSINEKWRLGRGANGKSMGYVSLHSDSMTPRAFTPDVLTIEGGALEVEEVRDTAVTNCLRQILVPEGLVDIVTNSAFKYTMNFYHAKDVLALPDTNSGYYVVSSQAQAFVSVSIENPASSTNDCDTLLVVNSRDGTSITNIWQWTNVGSNQDWVVTAGGLRTEVLDRTTNSQYCIDVRTVTDKEGIVASKVRSKFRLGQFGYTLTEKVVDPDGAALTEVSTLYENAAETGRYERVSQTVHADGSWTRYDYNANGWKVLAITPWLNAATNAPESECHVITNEYTPVDSNDLGELVGYKSKPRTVTEKIADKVIARTYHAYYENDGGERVEVDERCADLSASYGAASNLRTVKLYNPISDVEWEQYQSDKIKSITYPDGRVESTSYERGNYTANANPAQCSFTAVATGEYVRVTVVHGTTDSTNGVALKTTKDVTVQTSIGYVVMKESYVYTGSGYERIAWTVNTLDEDGHTVAVSNSDGTRTDTSWACCGKDSETDGQGGVLNYTYDALKRVTSIEREGIAAGTYPAQADQFTSYTYDAEGRKLTQTIQSGGVSLVTSNQYDLTGRLVSSVDPAGMTTQYAQSGLTNTTIRCGVTNVTVRYLDGNTCCTLENGVVKSSYAYGVNTDGTHWTIVYTGPQGTNSPAWTKTTTDLLGRTIAEEKPGYGGTVLATAYSYNTKGQLTSTTQQPNNSTTLSEYDDLGQQIRSGSDVNGNGSLDLAGPDRIKESDTYYQSDSSNNYWQVRTSILYAGDNSATPTTNRIQKTRLTGLGSSADLGLLTSDLVSRDLLGTTTTRTYVDRDSRTVTQVVDSPDSITNAVQVTVNGLLVASTSKTGIFTTYAYDALMRPISQIGTRTASTTHYNALGQVDSTMDAASNTTTYVYDSQGRRTQVTDALSNTTYTAYDIQGRVTNTWGATYPVAYVYDSYGRMTEMMTLREENGSPDATRCLYDEATGLLTNKLYADNKGPAYTYTSDGKLASRTWARGVVASYSYDSLGQLTNIHYSAANTPDVSFTYNRIGRQTTITDGQGTRTFTYNDALQLASELVIAGGISNQVDRAYDQFGRSAGFDAGTNYTVRYAFDQVGRFTAVSNNVGGALRAATYSYLPGSDILAGLSNGPVQITRSYEENRNLITQVKNRSGSTTISQYDYANDSIGRRTWVGMAGDAFSELGISHNKYAYNMRSELEQAKRYAGTNLASTANAIDGQAYLYGYDLIGNRTEVYTGDMLNGSKHTYTANALNQYTQKSVPAKARIMGAAASDATITVNNQSTTRYGQYFQSYLDIVNSSSAAYPLVNVVGAKKNSGTNGTDVVTSATGHVFVAKTPEQFRYDDDGNLTQDGRWSYTWDAENRLIGMETLTNLPSSVPRMKLAFAYDYMSRRIGKTVSTNNLTSIIQTSSFRYDGWNLITEICNLPSQMQTNVSSFAWGLDLSGTLQGAGGIGGLLSSTTQQPSNSTTAFYLFDANGNIGQLVSTNGAILARYEYDPYGKLIKDVADTSVKGNPFKFSSKYTDAETGLIYYGYRYYVPETGRWVSRDPIGEKGGRNLYAIAGNDCINNRDLLGLVSYNKAVLHWWLAYGADYPIDFSEADPGATASDFKGFSALTDSACNRRRTEIVILTQGFDLGVTNPIGRHAYDLIGLIKADCDTWIFEGRIASSTGVDPFDFDPSWFDGKDNNRGFWKEMSTWGGAGIGWLTEAETFDFVISGDRRIAVSGNCPD